MSQQGSRGFFQVGGLMMNRDVLHYVMNGAPVNGTSGTLAGKAGPGSTITRYATGAIYVNTNTKASPTWSILSVPANLVQVATLALTAANIIALNSVPLVVLAAPGTGKAYVVHGAMFSMTYGAPQFTGGGVVSFVDHSTHTAVHTGGVPAATVQAAASCQIWLGPLVGANGTARPLNTGIDIECATADFAAGASTGNATLWYSTVTA